MENRKTLTKYLVVVLLIIGGLGVLGKLQDRVTNEESKENGKSRTDFFEMNNFMGGSKKEFSSVELKGGSINCVMGGAEVDLSNAILKEGAALDVFLLMGGAKVFVPKDWNIILDTVNIMGDSKDQYAEEGNTGNGIGKTLKIKGTVVMGGLEIIRI